MRHELWFRKDLAILTVAIVQTKASHGNSQMWKRARELLDELKAATPFSWAKLHMCAFCVKELLALEVLEKDLATLYLK